MLRAHERHSRGAITAAHGHMKKAVAPTLALLMKELAAAKEGERQKGLWWLFEHSRLQSVQMKVKQAVGVYAASAAVTVDRGRKQAISIGSLAAVAQLRKGIPAPRIATPAHAGMQVLQDKMVTRFGAMPDETNTRVRDALLLAASAGITLVVAEQLLSRAIDRLAWWAISADINAEYDAFRETLGLWYQANSEYVEAWSWATCEDERVCAFCESMEDTIHPLDEEMESHGGCRCEMEPYFVEVGSPDLLGIA